MGSLDANPAAAYAAFAADVEPFRPLDADDVRSYLHKAVYFVYDYY